MLYRFAWVMMWITFKIFFRRIDLVGLEKLKSGKPAIVIANHPASFLDAMVLAVFLKRSIHFYVRGDIFAHPLAYKVLTMLHMIPIFSREHGVNNLANNKRTFDRGRKLLEEGKLLLIFPEGFSRQSKQLEPFKKGAARVALQTAFEGGKVDDLQIQTIALNYSYHHLGANLLIRLGDAITLEGYEQQYEEFPAMAITQLNKEMSGMFQQNVIHVKDGNRTNLAEALIRMRYHEKEINDSNLFEDFRNICSSVDQLTHDEFLQLQYEISAYEKTLMDNRVSDHSLFALHNPQLIKKFWFVYYLAPFAIFGKLMWWLPGRLSIWIADKTVTRIDFYTSVLSGVLGFMGLLWWLFIMLVAHYSMGNPAVLIAFILPLFSYIYMQWEEQQVNLFALIRLKQLKKKQTKVVEQLIAQRSKIVAY
jgi:1-acyl-sn-glycerol-3-phosphate acyltransferase